MVRRAQRGPKGRPARKENRDQRGPREIPGSKARRGRRAIPVPRDCKAQNPSNNQSESGPMVTTICGSEIARWTTFVPTQDNVTSKSDYGTALIVLDVSEFRTVGIFSKGESVWAAGVFGAVRFSGQEVKLNTWGTSYFGTGSIFLVEAM